MNLRSFRNRTTKLLLMLTAATLLGCSSDSSDGSNPTPESVIGGFVRGLPLGQNLVLQNNGGDNVTVSANGSFVFPSRAASGTPYAITILSQPRGQHCVVANADGTVGAANLTPTVTCPHFAYVTNAQSNSISAYAIQPELGVLLPVPGGPVATGSGPNVVTIGPDGKFAYVANVWGNSISAYRINPSSGALTEVAGSPFAACGGPWAVTIDPGGRFIYASNTSYNGSVCALSIYPVSGALTPIAGSPFEAGAYPSHVVTDPSGAFAYVTSAGGCYCLYAYKINALDGSLAPAGTVSIGNPTVSVSVDNSGKFVYVADYTANNIHAFTIDPRSGALSSIAGSPFAAGIAPSRVTLSNDGKFAYVPNAGPPGSVSAYHIDGSSGALTAVVGSPFAAPDYVSYVTLDPSGKFAYAGGGNLSAYRIDSSSGALISIAGSPYSIQGGAMTIDPTGQFAYFVNANSNQVMAYRIDGGSGALTIMPGAPFATQKNPQSITIW